MALGSYPDVSLMAARKERDAARLQKSKGLNPVQVRKVERLKNTLTGNSPRPCTPRQPYSFAWCTWCATA